MTAEDQTASDGKEVTTDGGQTRRQFLGATAGAAGVALAGCSSVAPVDQDELPELPDGERYGTSTISEEVWAEMDAGNIGQEFELSLKRATGGMDLMVGNDFMRVCVSLDREKSVQLRRELRLAESVITQDME